LVDKVKEFVDEQLETIAQTKGYKTLEARVMPDHRSINKVEAWFIYRLKPVVVALFFFKTH
jgi:hypothetical protein